MTPVSVRALAPRSTTAMLTLGGAHDARNELPSTAQLGGWMARLADDGYEVVRTSALAPAAAGHLAGLGFVTVQRLALLALEMSDARCSRPPDDLGIERLGRHRPPRRHLARLARLDREAFGDEWSLDERGLADALDATHRASLFVAGDEGFAIAGLTDDVGYLQRLAVSTAARRVGVGSALVSASVAWLRGRGCTRVLVNTETDNHAALGLYAKFGFRTLDHSLSVMERRLAP